MAAKDNERKNQTVNLLIKLTLNAHLTAFYMYLYPEKTMQEAAAVVSNYTSKGDSPGVNILDFTSWRKHG